jgi:hypothetical protein
MLSRRFVCLLLASSSIAWATWFHRPLVYTEAQGEGYPLAQAELEKQRDTDNVQAMRRHGWDVWAAMTRSSVGDLPAFLTWYQADELFSLTDPPKQRHFRPSFNHPAKKTLGLGDAILSFNTYNQPLFDHVRKLGYHRRDQLKSMVGKTPKVVNFPDRAIMVKTVWWPVRGDGPTAFPVWDEFPTRPVLWGRGIADKVKRGDFRDRTPEAQAALASHELHGNDFETFARVVAIQPDGTADGHSPVRFYDPDDLELQRRTERSGRNVALDRFYHLRLDDPKLVAELNSLPDLPSITQQHWGRPLRVGDYLAFVAAHVSTRELDDWVWTTYWWHDEPNRGPGADRTANVQGVWRHYKMRVAYNAQVPREPDGSHPIVYNPYLEAGFSDGPRSNCVSCHQRAVVTASGAMGPVFPVPTGHLNQRDPFFQDKLQLDFVWSLATRSI